MLEREWRSWPASDIREMGEGIAKQFGLSEDEARSLTWNMMLEAGYNSDGSRKLSHSIVPESEINNYEKIEDQFRRRFGKQLAKDPANAVFGQARSAVAHLKHDLGCLSYSTDDGLERWFYPADVTSQEREVTERLMDLSESLRKAIDFDNAADQVRLAFDIGIEIVRADFVVRRLPEIEGTRAARRKGGASTIKGASMEERRERYWHWRNQGLSKSESAYSAAHDLDLAYNNIRSAFPKKRLP